MTVERLTLDGFRNISELEIEPDKRVNIIFGENAQGKTNLIEALWLFTGCKSFRTNRDSDLISFENTFAKAELDFTAFGRTQNAKIFIDEKRKAQLNGVSLPSPSRLIGEFTAVVFSPAHLALVKDGPAARRKFIDTALCQLKPKYASLLQRYNRSVQQRNALLKDIQFHPSLLETLDVWDEKICSLAELIIKERIDYINKLSPSATEIYRGLSGGKEALTVEYCGQNGVYGEEGESILETLKRCFKDNRRDDILQKSTSAGPHRDDLDIKIDGRSARIFGSQGQQRSSAIALKLGEADIVSSFTGEKPVALLDDVMSELDIGRQDYILNRTEGWQVFITCCEPSAVMRLCEGKTFEIKNGGLKGK